MSDASDIEKLAELRDKGILTSDEFEKKKAAILSGNSLPKGDSPAKPTKPVPAPWKVGGMIGYVILSLFIPIVGFIIGIVAMAKGKVGKRVGQGVALFLISIFSFVAYVGSSHDGVTSSLGLLGFIANRSASTRHEDSGSTTTAAAVAMDYNKLYREYQANPIKADALYKGKLLTLTGKVDKIDREIMGQPYVTFAIGDYEDIRLTFASSEEDAIATLTKGQTITVTGTCKGTLLSTTVALDDCVLAK